MFNQNIDFIIAKKFHIFSFWTVIVRLTDFFFFKIYCLLFLAFVFNMWFNKKGFFLFFDYNRNPVNLLAF